eukprot:TRINITY_DN16616_c0_g1_i2.p1 TRINITY_DN16616_c0_g1~~TRINITY_DN16616_c0_g1_i2.p1  ORF type:complete len:657 (-),score=89.94 TRINITY_DN16616_c0_g1_i2:24-1832(-)
MPAAAAAPAGMIARPVALPVSQVCPQAVPVSYQRPQESAGSPAPVARWRSPHMVEPQEARELVSLNIGREANSLAVSPDGRRIAVALQDHTLQIWDVDAQILVHVLRGHKYWVNDVVYSQDGYLLASASADKSIKVWMAAEGRCEATLQGHLLAVSSVAFSSDARRLASGSWDKTVCLWDADQCRCTQTLTGHTDWVHSVAWVQGGHHVASASSDHSVRVWNAISGIVEQVLVGHLQTVSSVSFSRSGVFLASGSLDGTVRVWNLREGSLVARLQQDNDESSVHTVAFSPDGERIAVGCGDRCVKVWSFRTGEQELNLPGHEDTVTKVAVTSDGQRVMSCSHDKMLKVWRLPAWRPRAALAAPQAAVAVPPAQLRAPSPSRGSSPTPARAASPAAACRAHSPETLQEVNQRLRRQLSQARGELEDKMNLRSKICDKPEEVFLDRAPGSPPFPAPLALPQSPGGASAARPLRSTAQAQHFLSMMPTIMAGSAGFAPQSLPQMPVFQINHPAGSASPGLPPRSARSEASLCAKCGNHFMPDSAFCRHCGARREQAQMAASATYVAEPLTIQAASPYLPGYTQSYVAPGRDRPPGSYNSAMRHFS